MTAFVLFKLKRRFSSKGTIAFNILLFLLFFLLFHLDWILETDSQITKVYLDSSTKEYWSYFESLNNDDYQYYLSDEMYDDETVIIHKEESWQLISEDVLSEELIEQIENDILNVEKDKYLDNHYYLTNFVEEYENITVEVQMINESSQENLSLTVLFSLIYFLLVSYGNNISQEIMEEKDLHLIDVLLTNIEVKDYLLSKIITGYLLPFTQTVLLVFYAFINGLERYLEDQFAGLTTLSVQFLSQEKEIQIPSIGKMIGLFLLLFSCLTLFQMLLLWVCSKFHNHDEANGILSLIYMIILLIYFGCNAFLNADLLNTLIIKIVSYIPLLNLVFMSGRIIIGNVSIISVTVTIMMNFAVLYFMFNYCEKIFKKNILN